MEKGIIPQPKRPKGARYFTAKIGINPWTWTHFVERDMGKYSKAREIEVFFVSGESIRLEMTGKQFENKYKP